MLLQLQQRGDLAHGGEIAAVDIGCDVFHFLTLGFLNEDRFVCLSEAGGWDVGE